MRKVIFLIAAIFSLAICINSTTFASTATKELESSIQMDTIDGIILTQDNKVSNSKTSLKNISIFQDNGSLKINGTLNVDDDITNLELQGNLYPVTGNGIYADKVLLAEMEGIKGFNILQVRFEKDSRSTMLLDGNEHLKGMTVLTITLENEINGNVITFQKEISEQQFKIFYNGAHENVNSEQLSEQELKEKTTYLMNMNNFSAYNKQKLDKSFESTVEFKYESDTNKNVQINPSIMSGAGVVP